MDETVRAGYPDLSIAKLQCGVLQVVTKSSFPSPLTVGGGARGRAAIQLEVTVAAALLKRSDLARRAPWHTTKPAYAKAAHDLRGCEAW